MRILLMGAPGSGKGTQCTKICEDFEVVSIVMGDTLRSRLRDTNDKYHKVLADIMGAGKLAPDELILDVLIDEISSRSISSSTNLILDGCPRTIGQAEGLEKFLSDSYGCGLTHVINIDVDYDNVVERICGRFSCAKCKHGYHDKYLKPKKEGVCDNCGSTEFTRRKDDNEDVLRSRLEEYKNFTLPLFDYYKERGVLFNIDGNRDHDVVYQDIRKSLHKE